MPLVPRGRAGERRLLIALAVVGIIYGAAVAMMQADIKKLVAYSSVSHLGLVMLGLFVLNMQGVQGGIYQMLNHGLSTGALFLLVGMIYDRRHSRMIEDFGGLVAQLPVFSGLLLLVTFSSIGLPGLNGFVGEFLDLAGRLRRHARLDRGGGHRVDPGRDLHALDVSAGDFWPADESGKPEAQGPERQRDPHPRADRGLIVFMGVYPQPFFSRMKPSIDLTLKKFLPYTQTPAA